MDRRNEQENVEFLAGQHPLMEGLQKVIADQLIRSVERYELELKEIVAKKKKVETEKEETGVRLYNAQQQLAENQMSYEKAHDNYNIIQKLRIESEQKLSKINEGYTDKKQRVVTMKSQVTKAQKELENLMRHYHDIETYNLQLKSDIAVTRTEAFTAEKSVANLQAVKKRQDLLIDSMNEEIKRLEEQKNILAAQLVSQKEETEEAKKVLRDAQLEMGRIIASKKNLLERWQRSLSGMQKMDEALQSLKESYKQQEEQNILLITELNGIKTEIRKEEAQTEKLTMQANRLSTEKSSLELKRNELGAHKEKILQQSLMLEQSLRNTEEEIKKIDTEKKMIDDSMYLIETNIMKLHTETKKLLQELINQKGQHTTIEKTAAGLLKQAHKLGIEIEEKEVEKENIMNEIARVRIDQLNTKTQIELLEQKKKQVEKDRYNKEILVATYEIQIREGHDLNEKKQHEVGRLNKLHDELVSSANQETKSPLENKLNNLTRETEELDKLCNELERQWIKKQTSLVHQSNTLQELGEAVTSLETKKNILENKKSRLNANYKAFEQEITSINISLKGLRNDMNKLNDRLAVNNDKRGKLLNQNVNIQSQFGQKLKDLERQSVSLQVQIDALRQEKADLLNQIIESQRQILLWERNYQLEKEMQDALDPNVGQSEIEDLKKEIHRMELKFNSIKKAQDEIQNEMVRAAKMKETIQVKYGKKPQSVKGIKEPQNSMQLKSVMKDLRGKYNNLVKNIQDIDRNINNKQQDIEKVNAQINDTNDGYLGLERETHELQNKTLMAKTDKLLSLLRVKTLQDKYKKNEQVANNSAKLMYQEPVLRANLAQLKQRNNQIYQAVDEVATRLPQYREVLDMVLQISQVQ